MIPQRYYFWERGAISHLFFCAIHKKRLILRHYFQNSFLLSNQYIFIMKRTFLSLMCLFTLSGMLFAQHGKVIENCTFHSSILNMDRPFAVYLPAGYDESTCSYPVLYLLHGHGDDHTGWVQFGQVAYIADKAIAEGKACPMIIVMPNGDAVHKGYFNLWDGSYNYEDYFFKELIPYVEKNFRTRTQRRYRAISGLSMGGGGTLYYTLHHPELFAAACPLSGALGGWNLQRMAENVDMTKIKKADLEKYSRALNSRNLIEDATPEKLKLIKSVRWYISCGDDDFLYRDNSEIHMLFREKEIPHEYRVKDGAHTWTYWRMELAEVLPFITRSFCQY